MDIFVNKKLNILYQKMFRRMTMEMSDIIKVSDVMSEDLISVDINVSVTDVAKLLIEKGISSVIVTNSEKIVGIATERDFVRMYTMDHHPEIINDIASKDLITVGPDEDVFQTVRLMGKHKIRHLLVKKGDKYVGIVSLRDILKIQPDAIYGYIAQKN